MQKVRSLSPYICTLSSLYFNGVFPLPIHSVDIENHVECFKIAPLITQEMLDADFLLDQNGEITVRVSFGSRNGISGLLLTDDEQEQNGLRSYDEEFVNSIKMDSLKTRLRAQMGNPLFSDAVLHILDEGDKKLMSIPVHRVIVAGMPEIVTKYSIPSSSSIYE